MGNAYSWIRAIAYAKEHWYHATTTASVLGLTGSFAAGMACGIFRKCDSDPCGTPIKKSMFDKPACNYWEHGGDDMLPMRRRDGGTPSSLGTMITVINGMKGWGQLDQGGYEYDEIPGVTIYSSNNMDEARALDLFGDEELSVTIPGQTLPEWIYITNAGDVPICIAGVRLRAPDGSEITVTGNLGRICGADHYESALTVLPNGEGKAASCVWIDRHGSNGLRIPGISFNLQTADDEDLEFYNITSVEDLCRAPFIMLQENQPPLSRRQLVLSNMSRNGSSISATLNFDSTLVKSNLDFSSAVNMCQGEFTKGPHFVSLSEGVYCDMSTRELYPVCKDGGSSSGEICFDTDQDELVERDREDDDPPSRRRLVERARGTQSPRRVRVLKKFQYVDTWN